jgi:hypothetical protein
VPKPVAGPADPKPRQVLAGGEARQSADSLIELERGKARLRSKLGNAQRLIEMIVDVSQRH